MAALAVRRADFLMALAYATDLATGHSRDFALRSCVLGMRFADAARLDQDTRRRIYHQALLRYIGCNADTHLLAAHWGDEITLRRELHHIDMGNRAEFVELMVRALKRKFAGAAPEELEEAVKRGLAEGPQVNIPILSGHCEVAQRIAERIGLPEDIRENLGQIYERWDGKGLPRGLSGNAVKFPVRVVTMAQDAIALNDHHGFAAMKEMIAKRAGGGYEPELVDIFLPTQKNCSRGSTVLSTARRSSRWSPNRIPCWTKTRARKHYLAIADMIDMRMPFTSGTRARVPELGTGIRMSIMSAIARNASSHAFLEFGRTRIVARSTGPSSPASNFSALVRKISTSSARNRHQGAWRSSLSWPQRHDGR